MTQYTDIRLTLDGEIATILLNRPDVLNAVRQKTVVELEDALTCVAANSTIRTIVITGAGKAFSAGADLAELEQLFATGALFDDADAHIAAIQRLTKLIVHCPQIVIAAVNGVAVGIGAEIALASDLRLCAHGAFFQFAEAKRGLSQTNGVMYFLPRYVGMTRAMDYLLSCARIPSGEALQAGLVSRVLPDEELLSQAVALAREIASFAPVPIGLAKQILRCSFDASLVEVMAMEVEGMHKVMATSDLREGIAAFAERRQPRFVGH